METILIKKKHYTIEKEYDHHVFKLSLDGKLFYARQFPAKSEFFYDFLYAHKRLRNAGVNIPKIIVIDKKIGFVVLEWISGPTVFEELMDHDLDEKIIEEAFVQNWHARITKLRLDFNPHNFKYVDGKLYYLAYKIADYKRDEDFSNQEFHLWLYTNKFRDLLIEEKLPIDKKRIKNEYERNKELVLLVVKYFK